MKLPCRVVEDLLPMYHDGICSSESAAFIEEHLRECPRCGRMLSQLRSEIEISKEQIDDLKPLKEIQKQWTESKRASKRKGVCITLAALLVIVSVWAGIWYFGYAVYYTRLANKMEELTGKEAEMTAADYKMETENYQYLLKMPVFLSDDAFVRMISDTGIILFFYPEFGGKYVFNVMLGDENGIYKRAWLNPDLTPNFESSSRRPVTDEEKEFFQKLLDEKRGEIIKMFNTIEALWGIKYLTGTP